MTLVEAAIAEMSHAKSVAWQTYRAALFSTEPATEAKALELVEAVRTIGLPWTDVRGDASVLTERRKLEAQVAAAEAQANEAAATAEACQKKVDWMNAEAQAGRNPAEGFDFDGPSNQFRKAVADQRAAGFTIDKCEERLRRLQVESPRAFGNFGDV
jgi:hypothetical protein